MRTIRTSRMVVIEGKDGADFERKYNERMAELSRERVSVSDPEIDIRSLRAFVVVSSEVKEPECLGDEYELKGIRYSCGDCTMWDRKHNYCTAFEGNLWRRATDLCCDDFWVSYGEDAAMVYLPRNSDGTIDKRTREFKKLLKEGKCTRENS